VLLGAWLIACGAQTNGSAPAGSEAEATAGSPPATSDEPQTSSSQPAASDGCDPYSCECGLGERGTDDNGRTTCVGVQFCNVASDCPPPIDGNVEPFCRLGDQVFGGRRGTCTLPCSEDTAACPGDMQCLSGRCVFVTIDPNDSCTVDADCDTALGHRCGRERCTDELHCRIDNLPCRRGEPVCGCDGRTYPDGCEIFPEAVASFGACP
jgi:hypothetical protein